MSSPPAAMKGPVLFGGSLDSRKLLKISYTSPYDLGYGPVRQGLITDFIGREALEKRAAGPQRKKV